MLGETGATVYCTGRSSHFGPPSSRGRTASQQRGTGAAFDLAGRPETIEETAEMVTAHGGLGIPVQVDHTLEDQVQSLFERVRAEQGRLDVLVNDVWGGDELSEWGKPFWELSIAKGLLMQQRAVHSHIITSRYAAPLMLERRQSRLAGRQSRLAGRQSRRAGRQGRQGLIVEITDGDTPGYRGNLFYDLAKASVIRLAYAMSEELRPYGISALAVTPGFLRSEAMLDHFGVTEANWQDAAQQDRHFIASETPFFVGRAVAALAADPHVARKSGGVFGSWTLADEYGFKDVDGRQPHWGRYFAENVAGRT
jgi:NAD(P)-dependent dehydrogenase (short-subunit alcohol dehydrogenase family)